VRSEDELWALLREAVSMPFGSAQIALIEQVVQHADAGGFDPLRFQARMQATNAYVHGGEPAKSFVTFSWCLSEYDHHPDRYSRNDEALLLWHFKYMVSGLTKFPEVPLQRTYDVLDDMERRFRAGGHSLHAVYQHRWMVAEHVGDPAADEWFARWVAAPRDDNSDCVGCDPTSKVAHLAARHRDEEAVALATPVLAGRLTCVEQPQSILTELLWSYLRTGRPAEAADAHRRAYRRLQNNVADLASIGTHITFCALTGNELRGLEILERHLGRLGHPPSPLHAMWFAASAALLLNRLAATHPGLEVRWGSEQVPVGTLGPELARSARELAARFDARNGNTTVSTKIGARLGATPLVEYLPLTPADRAVTTGRTAPGAAPVRTPAALPADPEALLDHAETMLRLQRVEEARTAWRVFDERLAERVAESPGYRTPRLAARRLDGEALILAGDERPDEAESAFLAAASAYRAAGDPVAALVADVRAAALAAFDENRFSAAIGEVETLTERILERGDANRRAGALLRLANAYARGGRLDDAVDHLDRAAQEGATEPLLLAELAARRAHCLLVAERYEESARAGADARRRYAAFDEPPVTAMVCIVQAHALANLDRFGDAVEAFDEALRLADDRNVRLSAMVGRARTRLAAGEPLLATGDFVEAVAVHVAAGEDAPAAALRYDLATAYRATGHLLDAAEAGESAVETFDRLGAQDSADRARYLLSEIYRELDEPDRAITLLLQIADNLDGFDNLPGRGQMLEEAGQIQYELDRDALAAQNFARAAEAYHAAGLTLDELRGRRWRAVSLRWAEQPEQAVAALAEADALARRVEGDEPVVVWERAMLRYDGARVLIGAGRGPEAIERIDGVADVFRGINAFGEALHVELLQGELYLRLERPSEAEPVLREVMGAAPDDSQLRENAAWLLSEALEMLGRSAEAEQLRRDNGLGEA
jgi:cellulose synthase operon protein C